jgi:hypothetical protein
LGVGTAVGDGVAMAGFGDEVPTAGAGEPTAAVVELALAAGGIGAIGGTAVGDAQAPSTQAMTGNQEQSRIV